MGVALLSAQRSKDPRTQVGACLVDQYNVIIGTGYNGLPRWFSDDEFSRDKNPHNPLKNKHSYIVHAEANAILNTSADTRGARLYVGLFPCNECAKLLVQAWIQEVIYLSDLKAEQRIYQSAKIIFQQAAVNYRQLHPKHKRLDINFEEWASISK